jgi:hypothetical protein
MEVKSIRLFLSIFLGSITYISISISWNIETPVGGWTSAGFLFLFSSLCGWIFVIYLVLGLNKKKSYLRKMEKWDSPKVFWIIIVILWVIVFIYYYLFLYLRIFVIAICITIAGIMGLYMRNSYRKLNKNKSNI